MANTVLENMPATDAPAETSVRPEVLRGSGNAALDRLAAAVDARDEDAGAQAYSRTYHRHSRSHTRR